MYSFTNNWFKISAIKNFDKLFSFYKETDKKEIKFLEIGSFEGQSACYVIDSLGERLKEVHCIDTWMGGFDLTPEEARYAEKRFDFNIKISLDSCKNPPTFFKHKGTSFDEMVKLYRDNKNYFDLIYIDGSHLPEDIISDAILGFRLLKEGGVMIFDDAVWGLSKVPIHLTPKVGIDSFLYLYHDYLEILSTATSKQVIVSKTSNNKRKYDLTI